MVAKPYSRRKTEGSLARLSTFYVPLEEAKRFEKQIGHGDRGTALANLFLVMQKATKVHRGLWNTMIHNPERLEVRRKP